MGHTFLCLNKKWNRMLEFIANVFDVVAVKLVVQVLLAFQIKSVSNITSSGISAHPKDAQLVIFGVQSKSALHIKKENICIYIFVYEWTKMQLKHRDICVSSDKNSFYPTLSGNYGGIHFNYVSCDYARLRPERISGVQ